MKDTKNDDFKRYREIIESFNKQSSVISDDPKSELISKGSDSQESKTVSEKPDLIQNQKETSGNSPNIDPSTTPDDEIKDKMLYRATHPKKIGVFSAGGLSNKIVLDIKKDFLKLFPVRSFETSFDIFNRALIPIRETSDEAPIPIEHSISQLDQADSLLEKHDTNENEKDKTQAVEHREKVYDSKTKEDAIVEKYPEASNKIDDVSKIDDVNVEIDMDDDDDDYEFEPDPGSKFKESSKSDLEDRSQPEDQVVTEATRQLSFKERAQHILFGIKRKLGFTKSDEEHPIDPEVPDDLAIVRKKEQIVPYSPRSEEPSDHIRHRPVVGGQDDLTIATNTAITQAPEGVIEDDHTKPEQQIALLEMIKEKDILFIVACLDDPIDIENTLVLLELARNIDQLTIVISSLPRYFGRVENVHATNKTLQELRMHAELVVLIPYFETVEFKLIPNLIFEILELITQPGLINLDVADLKIVVTGGFVAVVTFGTGRKLNRAKDAFIDTLDSKLLNVELPGVKKALLNVTGGKDMTLGEVEGIAEQIRCRLTPGARLILGARVNPDVKDSIKLFLLLGVSPMQVLVNRYANE